MGGQEIILGAILSLALNNTDLSTVGKRVNIVILSCNISIKYVVLLN